MLVAVGDGGRCGECDVVVVRVGVLVLMWWLSVDVVAVCFLWLSARRFKDGLRM